MTLKLESYVVTLLVDTRVSLAVHRGCSVSSARARCSILLAIFTKFNRLRRVVKLLAPGISENQAMNPERGLLKEGLYMSTPQGA